MRTGMGRVEGVYRVENRTYLYVRRYPFSVYISNLLQLTSNINVNVCEAEILYAKNIEEKI